MDISMLGQAIISQVFSLKIRLTIFIFLQDDRVLRIAFLQPFDLVEQTTFIIDRYLLTSHALCDIRARIDLVIELHTGGGRYQIRFSPVV